MGIDFIVPFAATDKGHKYVCNVTDLFTKWALARPIKLKSSGDADKTIYSYGPPMKIIMDQGHKFINQVR